MTERREELSLTEDNSPSEDARTAAIEAEILSISALNQRVRTSLERHFPLLWVSGEVSNFTRAPSGHWYFSLKDAAAQVRCVMFRGKGALLGWQPQDGSAVEARALVTLYEPRGDYQLNIETLRRAGVGSLYEKFLRIKARLEQEGLFDPARKRPLPRYPRTIGIVTSPAAAALRDVLAVLRVRAPNSAIIIYPAPVQGEGAARMLARALDSAGRRADCDVIILCRGGGSIEDLWAFNEEELARAIRRNPIPVVAGIGHETDFTIADFAADARAPTPTAAAALASADRTALLATLGRTGTRLQREFNRRIENAMQRLDYCARRLADPRQQLRQRYSQLERLGRDLQRGHTLQREAHARKLDQLLQRWRTPRPGIEQARAALSVQRARISAAAQRLLQSERALLQARARQLDHLNPAHVLERGYSVVRKQDGSIVRAAAALQPGDPVDIQFALGEAQARITHAEQKE